MKTITNPRAEIKKTVSEKRNGRLEFFERWDCGEKAEISEEMMRVMNESNLNKSKNCSIP
jgi:hypothetical protein